MDKDANDNFLKHSPVISNKIPSSMVHSSKEIDLNQNQRDLLNILKLPLILKLALPGCEQAFNNKYSIIGRQYREGENIIKNKCHWNECSKEFEIKQDLFNHIDKDHIPFIKKSYVSHWKDCSRIEKILNHTKIKPYTRDFEDCSNAYFHNNYLRANLSSHTGETLYLCQYPECTQTFTSIIERFQHQNRTHDRVKPVEYICKVDNCRKIYSDTSGLFKHVLEFHEPDITDSASFQLNPCSAPNHESSPTLTVHKTKQDLFANNKPYVRKLNYILNQPIAVSKTEQPELIIVNDNTLAAEADAPSSASNNQSECLDKIEIIDISSSDSSDSIKMNSQNNSILVPPRNGSPRNASPSPDATSIAKDCTALPSINHKITSLIISNEGPSTLEHNTKGTIFNPNQHHIHDSSKLALPRRGTTLYGKCSTSGQFYKNGDIIENKCLWNECRKDFTTKEVFVKHIYEDHIKSCIAYKKSFVCLWKDCFSNGKKFKMKSSLILHMKRHIGCALISVPKCI